MEDWGLRVIYGDVGGAEWICGLKYLGWGWDWDAVELRWYCSATLDAKISELVRGRT